MSENKLTNREALQQGINSKNALEEVCGGAYHGECQHVQGAPVKINVETQNRKSRLGRIKNKLNNT